MKKTSEIDYNADGHDVTLVTITDGFQLTVVSAGREFVYWFTSHGCESVFADQPELYGDDGKLLAEWAWLESHIRDGDGMTCATIRA